MKLQPCEGCVYRVDTGREWPKGTPYHECHRRAPSVLPNEDGVPTDARPGANGMGCGERAEAVGETPFEVQMRQEVAALERIAAAVEAMAARQTVIPHMEFLPTTGRDEGPEIEPAF